MSGILIALILVFAIIILLVGWLVVTSQLRGKWKAAHPLGTKIPFDYTEEDSFTVMKEIFINRWIYRRKLIANFSYGMIYDNFFRPDYTPTRAIFREEYWTDTKKKDLGALGYKPVKGLHDSIAWIGVKTYMMVENGETFEVPDDRDEDGQYIYPQDTAETLQDYASSSATDKFISAMSKAATFGTMDLQKILLIGIVAVGAIFGMFMLGVF